MIKDDELKASMIESHSNQKETDCDSEPTGDEIHKTKNCNATPDQQQQYTGHPGWHEWYRNPEYVFAGSIALFTIVLTASAIYQAVVMERQWTTMERTLAIDQRAWLTIRQPMLNSVLAVGENPSFYMRIQNSGKSPAMKVRSRVTFAILDKLPGGLSPPDEAIVGEESRSLIAPGEYMRRPGELPVPLTQNMLDRLKRKEMSIFMYGSLIYFDIFRVEHRTIFCLFLPDIAKPDLSPCNRWNDAD